MCTMAYYETASNQDRAVYIPKMSQTCNVTLGIDFISETKKEVGITEAPAASMVG